MTLETRRLDSEDINNARREVARVYEVYRKGLPFTSADLGEERKKATRRIKKPLPSRTQSRT